jgi:hypothetical protein
LQGDQIFRAFDMVTMKPRKKQRLDDHGDKTSQNKKKEKLKEKEPEEVPDEEDGSEEVLEDEFEIDEEEIGEPPRGMTFNPSEELNEEGDDSEKSDDDDFQDVKSKSMNLSQPKLM